MSASHRQSAVQANSFTLQEHLADVHLFVLFGLLVPQEHLTSSTTAAGLSGYRQAELHFQLLSLPRLTKKRMNFGPLTKEFICPISTHPRSTMSDTIFQPLGGAAGSNFYMR